MVFPTHPEIGWVLIVGAALTSVLAEINQRWPGPLEAMVGRLRGTTSSEHDPFISLPDAARELYEANLDRSLGQWARRHSDGSEQGIFTWLAYWMMARSIVVYGRRTASTVLEPLRPELVHVGGIEAGASRFERDGFETYRDLSVKRDAFRAMIPALSETQLPSDF